MPFFYIGVLDQLEEKGEPDHGTIPHRIADDADGDKKILGFYEIHGVVMRSLPGDQEIPACPPAVEAAAQETAEKDQPILQVFFCIEEFWQQDIKIDIDQNHRHDHIDP